MNRIVLTIFCGLCVFIQSGPLAWSDGGPDTAAQQQPAKTTLAKDEAAAKPKAHKSIYGGLSIVSSGSFVRPGQSSMPGQDTGNAGSPPPGMMTTEAARMMGGAMVGAMSGAAAAPGAARNIIVNGGYGR